MVEAPPVYGKSFEEDDKLTAYCKRKNLKYDGITFKYEIHDVPVFSEKHATVRSFSIHLLPESRKKFEKSREIVEWENVDLYELPDGSLYTLDEIIGKSNEPTQEAPTKKSKHRRR